jgi:hypothetical protein
MTEHLGKGLGTTLEGERIGRERFGIRRLRFGAQPGRTLRDETPLPPSAREAAAIEAWFQTHDVSDTQIPMLQIPTLEIR